MICGQLHYAKANSGEQLLLLRETPRGYRFFEPILTPLALHFHVIALDLPGLRNSHELHFHGFAKSFSNARW